MIAEQNLNSIYTLYDLLDEGISLYLHQKIHKLNMEKYNGVLINIEISSFNADNIWDLDQYIVEANYLIDDEELQKNLESDIIDIIGGMNEAIPLSVYYEKDFEAESDNIMLVKILEIFEKNES